MKLNFVYTFAFQINNYMKEEKKDPRELISQHIKDNGLKQSFIAKNVLNISESHLSLVLNKDRELSEDNRSLFNKFYGTNY